MAKTNKYTSLNFNDLYISKSNPNRPSSSSTTTTKTVITNSRIHGNMLVLTRPSPKPITPPIQPPPDRSSVKPDSIEPDSISLRPLGRTGTTSLRSNISITTTGTGSVSPKINNNNNNNNNNNKFVPPHLRPGFHGKEVKPEQLEVKKQLKQTGFVTRQNHRPKSGGGYERDSMNHRPRSSGANRPVSSG